MMMGLHFRGAVPFRTVYIHGLVRDERGQKMSKSKGNIVDPLELIERYGADALRFTICALTGPGRDVKLGPKRVEDHRSFVTKLWNAARFCELQGIVPVADFSPASARLALTRWILDAANAAVAEATAALQAYRFDEYAAAAYRFTWNVFCDWFLELAKPVLEAGSPLPQAGEGEIQGPSPPCRGSGQGEGGRSASGEGEEAAEIRDTAAFVLGVVLRLLHPAMPFVTEELWDYFGYGERFSLIRAPWPRAVPVHEADAARAELGWLVRLVSEVRTVRAEMRVPPAVEVPILLKDAGQETMARGARWLDQIRRLARASELRALAGEVPAGSAQALVDEAVVVLPLAGVIDVAAERARLLRERDRAAAEAEKIERKLANADFVARAPEEVVEENRERLAAARAEVARLEAAMGRIGGDSPASRGLSV
jgi:valyl-tRNA synthetase